MREQARGEVMYSKYRRYELCDNVYGHRGNREQFKEPVVASMKLLGKNTGASSDIVDIWVFDHKEQKTIARIKRDTTNTWVLVDC